MSFEEYPPLSEFYRMRRYMERSLSEIKYDIECNKRRAQELAEELATAERSLVEHYVKEMITIFNFEQELRKLAKNVIKYINENIDCNFSMFDLEKILEKESMFYCYELYFNEDFKYLNVEYWSHKFYCEWLESEILGKTIYLELYKELQYLDKEMETEVKEKIKSHKTKLKELRIELGKMNENLDALIKARHANS